jgi:hypothetical protein
MSVLTVYEASNYTFGAKAPKQEKDHTIGDKLARMKAK